MVQKFYFHAANLYLNDVSLILMYVSKIVEVVFNSQHTRDTKVKDLCVWRQFDLITLKSSLKKLDLHGKKALCNCTVNNTHRCYFTGGATFYLIHSFSRRLTLGRWNAFSSGRRLTPRTLIKLIFEAHATPAVARTAITVEDNH